MSVLGRIFQNPAIKEKPFLFLLDTAQLLLFFYILTAYKIEPESGITEIGFFVVGAYTLIHFINKEFIPWVFIALTLFIVIYAFGLFSGGLLIGIFILVFITLTLRYNIFVKIGLFLLLLICLGFLRMGFIYMPRLYMIVPFIATMFIFRGFMYLYYEKNHKLRGSFKHRLAYFFMFPNLVFLLFPIVDFKEFVNSFLVRPFSETRQKALRYLLRGLIHLLLYRLIYTFFFIDESAVNDLPSLLHYMVSAYLLILRLSGILHLSMALICLFGYDLSPVFNYYFLGSSFTDLWRRINTYWRNFMQKVFFYPFYFRIRKILGHWALPIATGIMFVFTWFFHNYQFFWLRGGYTFSDNDSLFWFILGSSITLNVAWLDYRARKRRSTKISEIGKYAKQSFFILFCFSFMSFLWSLWSSESIAAFNETLKRGGHFSSTQLLTVLVIFASLYLIIFISHFVYYKTKVSGLILLDSAKTRILTIPAFLLLAAYPIVFTQLNFSPNNLSKSLFQNEMSAADKSKMERGYYKQLIDGSQPGAGSWEVTLMRPIPTGDIRLAAESTTDIYLRRLKPSTSIKWDGKQFSTNKFGMRDKEYTLVKRPEVYRIALIGGSYEMGSGVANKEVFESIVETELNKKKAFKGYDSIEILNFACGGYHVMQQVKVMEEKVLKFNPDAVMVVGHSRDRERLSGFYADLIEHGINLEYDYLKSLKKQAKVKQSMSKRAIKQAVMPFMDSLVVWSYKRIADNCHANNIKPIWIFLPATNDSAFTAEKNLSRKIAMQNGYATFDFSRVYDDAKIPLKKREKISVSKDDPHPNARGHRIIARALVKSFTKNSYIFTGK
jgi:hypothetical protein